MRTDERGKNVGKPNRIFCIFAENYCANISCVKQRNIFFSFIYRDGHWELSPAYDLTYNETLGEHATSVNFKGLPSDEDMITIGMNTKMSRERCLEIIREVKDALQTLNHNP